MSKEYYVYIVTDQRNYVLYTGVTGNISKRVIAHQEGRGSKFTNKYKLKKLVYYKMFTDPENAIKEEKRIKAGSRIAKAKLVDNMNPNWVDLSPHF
jgi:putative endonuclease